MAISGVDPKCYILALFVRDDGVRFLLGDDPFEFKDKQLHFQPNTVANDVVEVQGNDGYLLAGQVRRPGTQMFDGYVCNGTNSKEEVEVKRRAFLQFFRRSHFYKVIYVFPNGTAIQRKQGFLVDDPTVQELYQQYPEYHVALNFEDVNYYTYEEDDQGHEIYAKEAIIKLAGGGATGGLIWDNNGVVWENQWGDIVTVSGVDFQVDNSLPVRVPIEATQLKGDIYQQTYSGANLYNYTDTITTPSSDITTDSDGWLTCTYDNSAGTSTHYSNYYTRPLALTPSTDYALVLEIRSVTGTGYLTGGGTSTATQVSYFNIDFRNMTAGNTIVVPITSKSDVSGVNGLRTYFRFDAGQSGSVTLRISVLADTSVTPETFVYQPFTGNIPAPNPDYPQAVQTVTGAQMVKTTGKNLWGNISQYGRSTNGISFVTNQDGTISATGTATANAYSVLTSAAVSAGVYITLSAGTYTLSEKNNNTVQAYEAIAGSQVLADTSTSTVTFTLTETKNIVIRAVVLNGQAISGTQIFYPMLESGSTITTYQPYQSQSYSISLGSIELCKIGNYQDYIYKSGDDWYVHKEIYKKTLNGSESWEGWGTSSQTITRPVRLPSTGISPSVISISNSQTGVLVSDSFISGITQNYLYGNDVEGIATANSNLYIKINKTTIGGSGTLDDFKNWLTSNNVIVYYVLATPTDTKITDATLVGQLEALDAMRLFIGENNILVSASSPNLPATLQFDYYTQYLEPHGAEWEEGGTKGATIVDVDAIDNTYPVWELIGPAINPTISVLTTNTTLTYNGTITASQKLVIDMFNKTATLNGTSVIGNVTGDFVYMAPGTNRVAYTAGNADAPDSKISWQEVVG